MDDEAPRWLLTPRQKSLDRDQRVVSLSGRVDPREPALDLLVSYLAELLAFEREVSMKKTPVSANGALAVLFRASREVLRDGVIPPGRARTMLAQSKLSENSLGLTASVSK